MSQQNEMLNRVVAWFSCGAASAVAAKLAVKKYGEKRVWAYYCDTLATEHPDNKRFMDDVEDWLGIPIVTIRSRKYATVDDVFEKTGYMSGPEGARCTVEMKKIPRFEQQQPDDIHVFGLTADWNELQRIKRMEANNPELNFDWILRDQMVSKVACYAELAKAGIALPTMYSLGFDHNNCIGCVKATSPDYWNLVRHHFPEVFERRSRQSRQLGVRLVRVDGERIFLDELLEDLLTGQIDLDIECGPLCLNSTIRNVDSTE